MKILLLILLTMTIHASKSLTSLEMYQISVQVAELQEQQAFRAWIDGGCR